MKKFETPELEIVLFSVADVITTSGCTDDELVSDCTDDTGWG